MSVADEEPKQRRSADFELGEDRSCTARRLSIADDHLAELGYEPELDRSRSTWQVAFMSCVLAAVPYGLSTTLAYPLYGGGPVDIIWGWFGICIIMICIAASLGEITSVYPTAGGVYYQTFMMSSPKYRRPLAYVCGWSYALGNVVSTLSVNMGTTLFFVGCINIFQTSTYQELDGIMVEVKTGVFNSETYMTYLIFLAVAFITTCISAFGNRWLPLLDTAAMILSGVGVTALVITVLAVAHGGRRDASYVFSHFEANTGWVPGWSFMIGTLHAAYANSAIGMVISMSEEVKNPAIQVPKAMVGATVMNMCIGLIFLIPLTFVLPELAAFESDAYAQPLPVILRSAIPNAPAAFVLTVPLLLLGAICGTGCTTATSRCIWAFARDNAMPGSNWIKRINRRLRAPANAMIISFVAQALLGLIYFGSTAAFNAFNGVGVIFLNLSYVVPILVSLCHKRRDLEGAPFHLGWFWGTVVNLVSVGWAILVIPLFCMPFSIPVTLTDMNYACVVFMGGILLSSGWYLFRGRTTYKGPPAPHVDRR